MTEVSWAGTKDLRENDLEPEISTTCQPSWLVTKKQLVKKWQQINQISLIAYSLYVNLRPKKVGHCYGYISRWMKIITTVCKSDPQFI